jgi:glycosyltransferase involved in cell wall biosynthesis
LKIALLTDGIWPFVIGGMQRHSFYLCKYLALKKVNVVLYHTTKNGTVPDLTTCFNSEVLQYIEEHYIHYPESDKFPGHYLRSSFAYSERIYNEIRNRKDLGIIYAKGLTGWKILKEKGNENLPPVCINVHGYEYFQQAGSFKAKLQQFMLRPAFKFINRSADYIFSYGGKISDIIRDNIPGSENKIIEIPAGVERNYLIDMVPENNTIRNFIFIGRFERRKGIQELMKALSLIAKDNFQYRFHFIGPVPDNLKINHPSITYWGEIKDGEQIRSLLIKADVLVCPSYAEGMPNVILEAMACGCAIIATDVGAVSLQVNADNGWLVTPGSSASLYEAIKQSLILPNNELYKKKTNSLEKLKANFVWDSIIDHTITVFGSIVKESNVKHA